VTLDTRAPVIAIAAPTSAAAFNTNESVLSVAGAANDDSSIAEVTWSIAQGRSGTATGTTAWSIASLPMRVGLNTLTRHRARRGRQHLVGHVDDSRHRHKAPAGRIHGAVA
jgi:hypothetical protein